LNNTTGNNGRMRGIGFYLIVLVVLLGTVGVLLTSEPKSTMTYSDVIKDFEQEKVKSFVIKDTDLTMELKDGSVVTYELPSIDIFLRDLGDTIAEQRSAGIIESQDYVITPTPWWSMLLPYALIIVVFVVFWYFMMNRQDGGLKTTMNFGKARARLASDDGKRVTFQDVAGADEEKSDLEEIVEFLKSPRKFLELGARIPKGVLLVGPPGTGKTLIAKAVAGEASVPFFSISGSDFVELYVGVGASRVRDLFEQAKKNAPSIVFIDEIDAVGRQRGAGLGGGHDEREQTLNQLLVEMDGFGNNAGVIVMAATNRADILDHALLRPGRFDRQVYIGIPDIKGRKAILNVHARRKPFEPDVNFDAIARATAGFTGADLENLLNESALLAARRDKKAIGLKEIDDAFLKVVMGNEKKSRVISPHERKLTAYHEAGHALITRLLPDQDPVHQISIVPRGRAGGFTMSLPKEDKYYVSKSEMLDELVVLLGGRVSENLILGDISTGASNDLDRASEIARNMVTKYGMSEKLGPITFGGHDEVFLGRDFTTSKNISDDTASVIDSEVKAMIDGAYQRCQQLLMEHEKTLHAVANRLLEVEIVEGEEFEEIFRANEGLPPSTKKFSASIAKSDEEPEKSQEETPAEKKTEPDDRGPAEHPSETKEEEPEKSDPSGREQG